MGAPVATPVIAAEYNTWAIPNDQPLESTGRYGANIATLRMLRAAHLLRRSSTEEVLRITATSYDITTVGG